MKTFNIYKKRDGQHFVQSGYIYADNFVEAQKSFAQNCANDLHKESYLCSLESKDFDKDGFGAGFYHNEGLVWNEDGDKIIVEESEIECFLSQDAIDEGFDCFSEDVYTWELREPLEYEEIFDIEDFENYKEKYQFFMAFENYRFFLYNGNFAKIADAEYLGSYSDTNDKFMGSAMDDEDFIKSFLN